MKHRILSIALIFLFCGIFSPLYSQLPSRVDNRNDFLIDPFEHKGHPCAFASSISYCFTYEINCIRNTPAVGDDKIYPYMYGYNFHNRGSSSASTADPRMGFSLAVATGIPNSAAFGGFEKDFRSCKWVNGYEKYLQGIKDRAESYSFFDCSKPDGITSLKQWLFDHGKGTKIGGVASFNIDCMGVKKIKVSSGPQAGKTLITSFGRNGINHTLTVVGYDDEISYDLNNDGRITTDIDINNDGQVNSADQEKGAFIILDSHIKWDGGFAYCVADLFSRRQSQGGIARNNQVYYVNVYKDYQPKYTLKTTITQSQRDKIKIYAGIAKDPNASKPEKVKYFAGAFNYAGGSHPMEGKSMSETIEIGLDVSDLVDSINGGSGAFFLCIDSKGGSGQVDKLSLMDYTGTSPQEYPYKEENVPISGNIVLGGIEANTAITNPLVSSKNPGFFLHHNTWQKNTLSLTFTETNIQEASIQLYDLQGKMVMEKRVTFSHSYSLDIPTQALAVGIYNLVIITQKPNNQQNRMQTKVAILN